MRRTTPRLRTFDYRGYYRYLLTCCTRDRRQFFVTDEVVAGVRWHLLHTAEVERFAVLAYCFMPDHLHVVVAGTSEASDCLAFIRRFKQMSGHWFARRASGRLWQRSAHDRVLRSDEHTDVAIAYVLMNPVRAGLVVDPHAYRFAGDLRGGVDPRV